MQFQWVLSVLDILSLCLTRDQQGCSSDCETRLHRLVAVVEVLADLWLWHVDAGQLQVEVGQEVLGVVVDLDALRVDGRHVWDVVETTLALLLLELERDAAHWAVGDALHEVRDVTRDLVAHALGWDDGDLIADTLVGVEVKRQTRVVLLDDLDGRALHSLGTDTHGCCWFSFLLQNAMSTGSHSKRAPRWDHQPTDWPGATLVEVSNNHHHSGIESAD